MAIKRTIKRQNLVRPVAMDYSSGGLAMSQASQNIANTISNVTKFVDDCGLGVTLKPKESWINIYKKGDFQEYHNHPDSFISAIYIIDSPIEDASKIYFQSPLLEQVTVPYIKFENKPTGHIEYQSQPGKLLIFRSYINHCVTQHLSDKNRISIAYNFYKI